jgi:hypothetical protein
MTGVRKLTTTRSACFDAPLTSATRIVHPRPRRGLRSARLRKTDRRKVDPFRMHDAGVLIAAIHRDWGEAQGNYDEFRFFTLCAQTHNVKYAACGI